MRPLVHSRTMEQQVDSMTLSVCKKVRLRRNEMIVLNEYRHRALPPRPLSRLRLDLREALLPLDLQECGSGQGL